MSSSILPSATPPASLFRRRSVASLTREEGEHGLARRLGPWQLILLGVGCTIGAGLFSLTGLAAADDAGPAVVIAYLIAATGCVFAGLCYSEMASMIPVAGSAYTYAYASLGEIVAWIIGWDLILEYAVAASTVAVSWSGYVNVLLETFGVHLPARLLASPFETVALGDGSHVHGIVNLPAALAIVGVSLLLIRGISQSAKVNAAIVAIKLAVIFAVVGFGLPYTKAANWHPFIPPNTGTFGEFGLSGIIRAAGMLFFAYIGFDAVSTAAQESRNPGRDMPIGLIGSLALCTLAYVVFAFVLTGLVNYRTMHGDPAPVATAIGQTPFAFLHLLVKIGIVCGFTSVLLVLLLGQSRILYAMARDGLLPRFFSDVHPRFRTPWRSNLLVMVISAVIAAVFPLGELGSMASIGTLFAFVVVCAGVLALRRIEPARLRRFRVPFGPLIPVCGIVFCLGLMASLGRDTWIRLVVWLAIGLVVYFAYGRRHARAD